MNPKRENILGSDEYWSTVQKIYTNFLTQYPDDVRRRFFYAYHAFEAGKYEVASRQFELIGDRWMEDNCWRDLEAYNLGRAYTYYKVGADLLWFKRKYEDSIKYLRLSAKYNPTPHAFYGTGLALMYVGRSRRDVVLLREAEQMLKKAIEFKADYTSKPEYNVDKIAEFQLENVRKYLKEIEGKGGKGGKGSHLKY